MYFVGFLSENEINQGGFYFSKKRHFLLRKRVCISWKKGEYVDEMGFHVGKLVIKPWVQSQQKSKKFSKPF